ncbi:MAG: hypothetical protein PHY62_04400 [Gallionella sp.]|nr:hypothetical protein [Gallionella sp.]
MLNSSIADLDELVLLCRDERARSYISEAVNCYRGGAYRAAIVATWIAVCFDIIDKLRELNLSGDKAAENIVEALDKARVSNDMASALKFERELLDVARDQFELLSHLEHVDLDRLQQDRNRCAHPSLLSDDQVFQPPGELARLHIRSAVTHLLQHPPVQGKSALERLVREVNSEYFPDNVKKATASLSSGPLKRPRDSLVRNFLVVLLKQALSVGLDWKLRWRTLAALGAVRSLHPRMFESAMKEKLTPLCQGVDDANLSLVIRLFRQISDCWNFLGQDVHHRIENYVANLPFEDLEYLDFLLDFPALKKQASIRLSKTTRAEFRSTSFFGLTYELADKFIAIYLSSKNYAEANEWAQEMMFYASDFSTEQQKILIQGIQENSQIYESIEVKELLHKLRDTNKMPRSDFDELLESNGLKKFV